MNEQEDGQESEYDNWLDMEAAKKLTGLFTNRVFVQYAGEGLLRLNFGEVLDPDDPTYHTALVISATNAVLFADLIHRMAVSALAPPLAEDAPHPDEADGER